MRNCFIAMLLLFAGCKIDHSRPIESGRLGFFVADDAELFFKNVRQIYYDAEPLPAARVTVYRHPDRMPAPTEPALWPALVLSSVADEAKILIENNDVLADEPTLRVVITGKGQTTEITLSARGREQMLDFATAIYKGIQQQATFAVYVGTEPRPWLAAEAQRDAFRITMADVYRLTGTL